VLLSDVVVENVCLTSALQRTGATRFSYESLALQHHQFGGRGPPAPVAELGSSGISLITSQPMSNESDNPNMGRAQTAWCELWLDIALLVVGCLVPLVSLAIDIHLSRCDWFQRSGAVTVLLAALVGYRSLSKHYYKFYLNAKLKREPLWTSRNQSTVDCAALVLSLIGTAIWGYGDKLL